MEELFALPQIVSGRTAARAGAGRPSCSARSPSTIVELEVGGGRAGQALHQHLALHQVRGGQPALHDRQRLRRSTSSASAPRSSQDYPRAADMPGPGLAAGPCLLKDTMQLAAFNNNNFTLGHASMMINEGLPLYLVARLEQQPRPGGMTVGVLGMAFKAESDDIRDSLSYKLKRLLRLQAPTRCCAPTRTSPATPTSCPSSRCWPRPTCWSSAHRTAPTPTSRPTCPIVDMWNLIGDGRARVTARACLGRRPRLQRGRGDRRRSSTGSSSRSPCPARCSRSTTRPRTPRSPTSWSTPRREPRLKPTHNTYGPRTRPARCATASTTPRPRSSS